MAHRGCSIRDPQKRPVRALEREDGKSRTRTRTRPRTRTRKGPVRAPGLQKDRPCRPRTLPLRTAVEEGAGEFQRVAVARCAAAPRDFAQPVGSSSQPEAVRTPELVRRAELVR